MYKFESERNKNLEESVAELEEAILMEKERFQKQKEFVEELQDILKSREKELGRCPHGKCPICANQEQEKAVDENLNEIFGEEEREEEEVEEEEDDGEDGGKSSSRKRRPKPKAATKGGQSPELGKKK
mmetsp:Transcript_7247/g.6523  ORF Transcript_7247/g.6523 Transcript_7247/m.6523 type:complete len:128 (-) Transcript_7247:310-693(-)